jgi:micrococcal nuclease
MSPIRAQPSLGAWRRRRAVRCWLFLGAAALLCLLAVVTQACARTGDSLSPRSAPATRSNASPAGDVQVVHVTDGDTVTLTGGVRVRYLGIDSPELPGAKTELQGFARAAADRNRVLVTGKTVRLETDAEDRDDFGRLLRHLWLGDELVAEVLIREGLGYAQLNPPNTRNRERLQRAQTEARAGGRGVWSGWPEALPPLLAPLVRPPRRPADGGPACPAESTPAEQSIRLVGHPGTVCLRAVRVQSTASVVHLRPGEPPSASFSAALFPALWSSFPDGPERYFDGQAVLLRGRVELYDGKPELVVRDRDDARVLTP